jgi:hypothetical protein
MQAAITSSDVTAMACANRCASAPETVRLVASVMMSSPFALVSNADRGGLGMTHRGAKFARVKIGIDVRGTPLGIAAAAFVPTAEAMTQA